MKTPREDTEDTVVTWRSPRQALPLNGDTMEDTKMTDCQSHQHQHDRVSFPRRLSIRVLSCKDITMETLGRHSRHPKRQREGSAIQRHREDNCKVKRLNQIVVTPTVCQSNVPSTKVTRITRVTESFAEEWRNGFPRKQTLLIYLHPFLRPLKAPATLLSPSTKASPTINNQRRLPNNPSFYSHGVVDLY
jgi:hypothetical protein